MFNIYWSAMIELFLSGLPIMSDPDSSGFEETWIWPRTGALILFPKDTWIRPQTRFCELVHIKFIGMYWTDTPATSANFIMSLHKPRLRGTEKVPHFALPWGQTDTNDFTWLKAWLRTMGPSLLPHKFQLLSSSSSSLCSPLYWIGTYSKFKKFRQEFQLKIKEDYVIVCVFCCRKSDISPHN